MHSAGVPARGIAMRRNCGQVQWSAKQTIERARRGGAGGGRRVLKHQRHAAVSCVSATVAPPRFRGRQVRTESIIVFKPLNATVWNTSLIGLTRRQLGLYGWAVRPILRRCAGSLFERRFVICSCNSVGRFDVRLAIRCGRAWGRQVRC